MSLTLVALVKIRRNLNVCVRSWEQTWSSLASFSGNVDPATTPTALNFKLLTKSTKKNLRTQLCQSTLFSWNFHGPICYGGCFLPTVLDFADERRQLIVGDAVEHLVDIYGIKEFLYMESLKLFFQIDLTDHRALVLALVESPAWRRL